MTRLLRPIIAMALTGLASTTLAYGSSTVAFAASSSASALSAIEVDLIFPIHNTTYNITESLPIVFALQNTTAAAALGPFTFEWDIMPYGKVGEPQTQVPGGVTCDYWQTTFTADNTTTEPYILVNQTDVQKWQYGPFYPYGSVYALQWYLQWDDSTKMCKSDWLGPSGTFFFNIDIKGQEPDLGKLIGQCPQLAGAYRINTAVMNGTCSAVVSNSGTGDPCAVTVNKAVVANISSSVQSLIAASAAAASPSPTATLSGTPHSLAVTSEVPLQYVLASIFLLGSLQMVMFL